MNGNYIIPLNTSLSLVEGNYTSLIIAQQGLSRFSQAFNFSVICPNSTPEIIES
jgi:hypothetical protein